MEREEQQAPSTTLRQAQSESQRKPWPLSWVLILILTYIALQTAYFLFIAK